MHYTFLDLYRYLAALIVCVSHFFFFATDSIHSEFISILGVELFFVLSGFVLTPQLLNINSNAKRNLKIFLFRRWIRTIPPYLIALLIASVVFGYGNIFNLLKFLSYTQNFISDNATPNFYSIAWSLSIEEWFYLTMPIFLFIGNKIRLNKPEINLSQICYAIILILNFARIYFNNTDIDWGQDIRRSVIFRIDSICFGVIAFIFKDKISKSILNFFIILGLIILSYIIFDPNILKNYTLYQNIFFILCGLTFSSLIIKLTFYSIKNVILENIIKLGANISYSMYLFHIIIIPFAIKLSENVFYSFFIYICILKVISILFYFYFEKPILKIRPRYN